jgi:CRP/FNR family cyclic AMP-dependent transcriptional regulator
MAYALFETRAGPILKGIFMKTKDQEVKRGDTLPLGTREVSVDALIQKHPFSADLSPHQQRILSDCAVLDHFYTGEIILQQGDPANRFYLIQQGRVGVEVWRRERGATVLQTLGPGEVLGWSWLFPPYYWQFTARALENTEALLLMAAPLRAECETDSRFGYELMKRVARVMLNRLQGTRRMLADFPDLRELREL